ncbi:type II toxin-antitoxin system Phd/YefM family antitoxin [Limnospira fusiformis]|uniref:type II toxin-antitoxin system Phd/YefM family antitoxin n=1 Tax=Limnospira fusiformis TaxID=54297 RepID=UPI00061AF4DF
MKTIETQQAKQQLDEMIDQVIIDVEPTILRNQKGQEAVLMSLEEFSAWRETIYLLSNPANVSHLLESIKQAESGQTILKELLDE